LLEPLEGTLPEPEIYARLLKQMGVVPPDVLEKLSEAARLGRGEFAQAFMQSTMSDRSLSGVAAYLLYETLGPTLRAPTRGPDGPELVGAASAAALWGLAHRCNMKYPDAVRRAGHGDGEALFDAMLSGRSGITFTLDDYEDAWSYVAHPDHRIVVEIPELLDELGGLDLESERYTSDDLPLVLSAGERRSNTANTIIRDPAWRKRDAAGALRVSPDDAARLGLADGGRARIVTAAGSAETVVEITDAMMPGHISLPNGQGLDYPDENGTPVLTGVPTNELTSLEWRDPIAGTPWHKHVPARVEAL
jgi:formate dehydrogenase